MLKQRGFGIVEAMIAMTISLVMMLGIASYFATSVSVNKIANKSGDVTNIATGLLDFMASELQLAGYNGKAEFSIGKAEASKFGMLEVVENTCVLYNYDENSDGELQDNENKGFRVTPEIGLEWGKNVMSGNCTDGQWQPMAPKSVKLSNFMVVKQETVTPGTVLDLGHRQVTLTLSAYSEKYPKVKLNLNQIVEIKNDVLKAKKENGDA